MIVVVLITKYAKEWMGIKEKPTQKRPQRSADAHGVVLCHGRWKAEYNGKVWAHDQEEMFNYSVPVVVAQEFSRRQKEAEREGAANKTEPEEEANTRLYRWWTI